jgi:hypothetical protein
MALEDKNGGCIMWSLNVPETRPTETFLENNPMFYNLLHMVNDRLCGLVVRVIDYRSGDPGSIPGNIRKKSSGSGTGSTQPREYNWGATS